MDIQMCVKKRDNTIQEVSFDKIINRVKILGNMDPPLKNVIYSKLVMKVIEQLYSNMETTLIDEIAAKQCASLITTHLDYGKLASRIIVSNHHKKTNNSFFKTMTELYENKNKEGTHTPVISQSFYELCEKNKEALDSMVCYDRDYLNDYFGFKTLEKSYLMKCNGVIKERPQDMWLRVSLSIHKGDLIKTKETYDLMSKQYFTHATPTLFNSGTQHQQLSSCFLMAMEDDSIDGIFNTLKDCASISKWAGGIGLHLHNIRGTGSPIKGTNGISNGIIPLLKVFNSTARYVDQGGGKRNGSFAMYLEPWHSDINDFLELKLNHGDEESRARDLFYALWIPDLFMEAVSSIKDWYLFCPNVCNGLSDVYGDEFETLYNDYVDKKMYNKKIKARDLWFKILDTQMETGTPYILYKDAANKKSNQKNLGTIKSSNLCTEIIQYSDKNETSVCNLASIALNRFVKEDKTFDYEKLHDVVKIVTNNLNNVIDINYYPTSKSKTSNEKNRPIGIGVQGLADTFALMDIPFTCQQAKETNTLIFETMYHASLEMSCELSILSGHYSTFIGSPLSKGIFQFDMWNITPSTRYDWNALKENIMLHGVKNSLLLAPMPTASTSQILGNNECFEPFTSNIYSRRTMAGEFVIVNKHLMSELCELGLWSDKLKNNIIQNAGSIQHIEIIPESIREKYKIVWEMSMRDIIDMSADRGAFICQSQSLNLWMEDPNYKSLTSMHFYSWKKGLKTGQYYLRRKPKHKPQQFTIDVEEVCESCSS